MGLSERLSTADEGEISSSCESKHWQCGGNWVMERHLQVFLTIPGTANLTQCCGLHSSERLGDGPCMDILQGCREVLWPGLLLTNCERSLSGPQPDLLLPKGCRQRDFKCGIRRQSEEERRTWGWNGKGKVNTIAGVNQATDTAVALPSCWAPGAGIHQALRLRLLPTEPKFLIGGVSFP